MDDYVGQFKIEAQKLPTYQPKVETFYRPDPYEGVNKDVTTWKDSDGDTLTDQGSDCLSEPYWGTNPYDSNTDNDGYNDYWDPAPLWRYNHQGAWRTHEEWTAVYGWRDIYRVRARVDVKYNENSKIVAFKNVVSECNAMDYMQLDWLIWDEYVSCGQAFWSDSKVHTVVPVNTTVSHTYSATHTCDETTSLAINFNNICDAWVNGEENPYLQDMQEENWLYVTA